MEVKKVLIGSKAIKHWYPDFKREPKDTDYAILDFKSPTKTLVKSLSIEYLSIPPLINLYNNNDIVSPNHLYTLKLSHIFWDRYQDKHLFDITFLRNKGCIIDELLFKELYEHWNLLLGENRRVDYDKPNDTFFSEDAVKRPIDHDELHLVMNPNPLYMLIKDDQSRANINKDLFFALDKNTQLELCREEAYVLALERFYSTGKEDLHWRIAYSKMLRGMIMRMSPLWFGRYVAVNYAELCKPTFNYLKKFKESKSNQLIIQ